MAFQNNSPAVEAAVGGVGLTLADPLFIRDELAADRLLQLGPPMPGKVHIGWCLLIMLVANPRVQAFCDWLRASIQAEPAIQGR